MNKDEQVFIKLAKLHRWDRYQGRLTLPNYAKLQRLTFYYVGLTVFVFISLTGILLFPIPRYISCTAIVLNGHLEEYDEIIIPVILFLPESYVKTVEKNQEIVLWLDGGESVDRKILISDIGLLSSARVQSEFNLTSEMINNIPDQSVLVLTDLLPLPPTISSFETLQGRVFRASVMVGSDQPITLITRYLRAKLNYDDVE